MIDIFSRLELVLLYLYRRILCHLMFVSLSAVCIHIGRRLFDKDGNMCGVSAVVRM